MRSCFVLFVVCLFFASVQSEEYFDETKVTTLFAFDRVSIPYTQNLRLEMQKPDRHPNNPVLDRGPAGSADSNAVQFYGSIIRENGTFRMWYVAADDSRGDKSVPRSSPWRVAYAESEDGMHWTKPNLGLVEHNGSTDNNLVLMNPYFGTVNVKVIRDDPDPDPNRRYKMGAHVWFPKNKVRLGTLAPYVSPDGFRWSHVLDPEGKTPEDAQIALDQMVLPPLHFEPVGGLYQWQGLFHLSGQNAIVDARPYHGRRIRTFVSPDFIHWSPESAVSFVRHAQHELLGPGRSREGEQTHEAISVWNRNNVLLGIYGIWHGGVTWDEVSVDLGFVVSNDGVIFREPMHEWEFLHRGADGEWDEGGLLQGQGFENVGDKTYVYYGAWDPRDDKASPPRGGVGIAVLDRDRFGCLIPDNTTLGEGEYQMEETECSLLTAPVEVSEDGFGVFVNAAGLGPDARIRVNILREDTRDLSGFDHVIDQSGCQVRALAGKLEDLGEEQVRFRLRFEGKKRTDIRFFGLYVK